MGNEFILSDYFPIEELNLECLKERKSASGQTLTGLGKWWGRKPLILVRAIILGVLMPISENEIKDKEIFLKILTMDSKGLELRRKKKVENFEKFSYEEKLKYCCRPEEVTLTKKEEWTIINNHLKTNANSLQSLIEELGKSKFGHIPIVGDCFAGGGSIPFEATRIGCETYVSDLNPIACLLNWANLNLLNKNEEIINDIKIFQDKVYDNVVNCFNEWGIETNEKGWKAKCYIYCNETKCPECGTVVPLAPSWIISKKYKTIAILKYNYKNNNFDIDIKSDATKEDMEYVKNKATVKNKKLICPKCGLSTSITTLKENIFKERLYCIKYIEKYKNKSWTDVMKKPAPVTDATVGIIHYCTPNEFDLEREQKVKHLIEERFNIWQQKGYIPSDKIEEGENTSQLIRSRGWMYWSDLFNSRQLLTLGLFMENIDTLIENNKHLGVVGLLGINKLVDFNSKLSNWASSVDIGVNTFYNQAFNPLFNYSTRACSTLYTVWKFNLNIDPFISNNIVDIGDARNINNECDIWITDPPYSDSINYHELSELFLSWDYKLIEKIFPQWYSDSKRMLAIKGKGENFNKGMIDAYTNLTKNMHTNGIQIIMFSHSDIKVWEDLKNVIQRSNLQIIKTINIKTETESGGLQKKQNRQRYTSLLICKKI